MVQTKSPICPDGKAMDVSSFAISGVGREVDLIIGRRSDILAHYEFLLYWSAAGLGWGAKDMGEFESSYCGRM